MTTEQRCDLAHLNDKPCNPAIWQDSDGTYCDVHCTYADGVVSKWGKLSDQPASSPNDRCEQSLQQPPATTGALEAAKELHKLVQDHQSITFEGILYYLVNAYEYDDWKAEHEVTLTDREGGERCGDCSHDVSAHTSGGCMACKGFDREDRSKWMHLYVATVAEPAEPVRCGVCGEEKLSNQHWGSPENQGDSGPYDGNTHWFQLAQEGGEDE